MTDDLGLVVLTIDHVGIAVPDLEAAIAFQRQTFGLEVTHREVNEEQGVAEAMLSAPDAPAGAAALQLLAPLRVDSAIGAFIDRSGPGLQQLAYRVADVEAAAEALRARGVRVLYETAKVGTGGSLINFAHPKDTGGVLVELVQLAESSVHQDSR